MYRQKLSDCLQLQDELALHDDVGFVSQVDAHSVINKRQHNLSGH